MTAREAHVVPEIGCASMAKSRQQTFAKIERERRVRERRERKQEKRRAAAEERKAQAAEELDVPVAGAPLAAPGLERS